MYYLVIWNMMAKCMYAYMCMSCILYTRMHHTYTDKSSSYIYKRTFPTDVTHTCSHIHVCAFYSRYTSQAGKYPKFIDTQLVGVHGLRYNIPLAKLKVQLPHTNNCIYNMSVPALTTYQRYSTVPYIYIYIYIYMYMKYSDLQNNWTLRKEVSTAFCTSLLHENRWKQFPRGSIISQVRAQSQHTKPHTHSCWCADTIAFTRACQFRRSPWVHSRTSTLIYQYAYAGIYAHKHIHTCMHMSIPEKHMK